MSEQRRLQKRFAVTFAAIAGCLFCAYSFPYAAVGVSERWFDGYLSAYARLVGHVLALVEPGIHVEGTVISGRSALRIVKACDGVEVNVLFAAAVFALPGAFRKKLVAFVAGTALLVGLNVVRIASLYYAGAFVPKSFEVLHGEVWPLALVVAAAAVFFAFAAWILRREHQTDSGA